MFTPLSAPPTLNGLVLAVDNPLLVQLGTITLNAGGLLMVLDGVQTGGILVNNTAVAGGDDGMGSVGITGVLGGP